MSSSVTATFVFTDLVDSTAIAARLGPAAAEELRQKHFGLLRGAVQASGGVEVKNLGDGLMVMYSSPSRALAGAVGMQQAIEHHNRSGEQPLDVRIGISVGEAVEEDGDYFGDPVVEAARLCATANGGQILAADMVRALVGRHATQTFVTIGALELRGIPDPVDAVEVLWEPTKVQGAVPLPGRLVGAASDALFGFFGRTSELAALEESRKRARSTRQSQVVFVAGEAGMGKTALIAQAARSAHEQGAIVLFGHADEDARIAYQPWIEVCKTLVRDGDPGLLSALASVQRTALARLVPQIGGGGERVSDPDMERLLLWEAVTELLAVASHDAVALVVLDDLHWADTATLQLLRHLIGTTTPMALTIACTLRDTDLVRGDPLNNLLTDAHGATNVTRVALGGLEDDEIVELMAAAAGHDLDETALGLAHALRRETDGNPFYTGEMLRHLGESGGIVLGDDGRWTVAAHLEELGLPNSVRDVVGRRVERLGSEALRVLRLAAICGREFDVSLVATLADIDENTLLDLMDAAVAAAVLVESGVADRYRFAHALIQHTLYDELSPTRRQRAHQRIAEILEARDTSHDAAALAELAHHFVAATRPADLDKALDYVRRAGDAARDALAPEDAIRWYQQALDLLDRSATHDEHLRAALLSSLGAAQRQGGDPGYRDTLLRAAGLAEESGDDALLVEAALGFIPRLEMSGDDDAKTLIRSALDRVGTDATPTRARLLATLSVAYDAASEWQTRHTLAVEAVDAARESKDDRTLAEVTYKTVVSLGTPDRVMQTLLDVEDAVAAADRLGDPLQRALSRSSLVEVRYKQADIAAANSLIAEIESIAQRVAVPYLQWQIAGLAVCQLTLAGRVDEAEAANERALEIGTAGAVSEAMAAFGGLLYNIRQHQGRLGEIVDFFLNVARDNPSIRALRAVIPAMLCEVGRVEEARERLAAEAAEGFDLPFDGLWLEGMKNLLDGAASISDIDGARTLVNRAAPYADEVIADGPLLVSGSIARPLARAATVIGDHDQAEEWFAIAHDLHTRLQAPYWTALGQLDHADLCIARGTEGDRERARAFATTAAATAAEYGCGGLTRRAERLLADL
jgi:class 3 adenylate cyclase/tetratricopeptide (TPR) repeat protein